MVNAINDKRPTSLQMTDPITTDPLLVPYTRPSIPDPRGLFCKRSTDGKNKVNYWTCTLCGYVNEKCKRALAQHAKSRKHLKAIGAPIPPRKVRKSKGDHAVLKLSNEVPARSSVHEPATDNGNDDDQDDSKSKTSMKMNDDEETIEEEEEETEDEDENNQGLQMTDPVTDPLLMNDNAKVSAQVLGNPSGRIDTRAITSERTESKNVSAQVLGNPSRNEIEPDKETETQVPHAHAGAYALERRNEPVEEETCFEEHRARAGKYKCFRNFNLLCDPTKALKKEGMDEDDDMDTSSDDDDTPLRKRFKSTSR